MMSRTPAAGWDAWLTRWERFQAAYAPERESQFETMCRYAVECGTSSLLRAVDLCAGPGSLGACLASRAPGGRVIAVDADPFLLELGRNGHAAAPIEWIQADLRASGWSTALGGSFDTVLCSTAMHWFNDEQVRAIYREITRFLRRGGAFLVADAMPHGTVGIQAASRTMLERTEARQIEGGDGENWVSFWRAVEAEPAFAELLIERERALGLRPPRVVPSLDFHIAALADAGFSEIGEVWRRDAWAIVLAVH
jgi:SAM-dependent methyltransferase